MKKEDQRRNCCTVTAASLSKIASSLNLIAVRARPRAQTEPFEAHNTQSLPMARGNSARRPAYFLMAVEQEPTLCIKSQQGYQAEGKRLDRDLKPTNMSWHDLEQLRICKACNCRRGPAGRGPVAMEHKSIAPKRACQC